MSDKKLSEVTKVTDMAYVPVILSDGSVGQIAKADLASVVAGLMIKATGIPLEPDVKTLVGNIEINSIGFIVYKDYALSCVKLWLHSSTTGSIITHISGSESTLFTIEGTSIYATSTLARSGASVILYRIG